MNRALARQNWNDAKEGGIPFGGMVSFRIKGGEKEGLFFLSWSSPASVRDIHFVSSNPDNHVWFILFPNTVFPLPPTAEKFLLSMNLISLAESLGGVETLAELPCKMTHRVGPLPFSPRPPFNCLCNVFSSV